MKQKQVRLAIIGLLVAVTIGAIGFLWGARGRWAAEERLAAFERRAQLTEARRLALAGQVALSRLNFGEASGLFDSARVASEEIAGRLQADGMPAIAERVRAGAQELAEARRLAGALDQGANARAGAAIAALDQAASELPPLPSR